MALQLTSTCWRLSLYLCTLAVLLVVVHAAAAADATRTQAARLADVDVCTLNTALCTPHSEHVRVVRTNASALVRICVVRAEGECCASVEKQRVVRKSNEHRLRRPHISRIKTPRRADAEQLNSTYLYERCIISATSGSVGSASRLLCSTGEVSSARAATALYCTSASSLQVRSRQKPE